MNLLLAAQLLGAAVAGVALAYAGWGLVGQFAALVIGGVIFHLGLAWDGIHRYPEVFARGQAIAGVGRSLWALSWPTLLFSLSGRLGLLTDDLVVAGLLGPTAVASFFLTQRVIAVAGTQVLAIGGATWAGLIDLHFRGEQEVFVRRFAQLTRLTAALGAGLLLPVAVWNRDLIVLWVGSDRYAGPWVTWLAAANACLLGATVGVELAADRGGAGAGDPPVRLVLSGGQPRGQPGGDRRSRSARAADRDGGGVRGGDLVVDPAAPPPAPQRPTTAPASGGGRTGAPGCPLWCRAGSSIQGASGVWAGLAAVGRFAGRGRLAGGSVRRILRPGLVPGLPRSRPGRIGRPAPRLASPRAGEGGVRRLARAR